MFIEPDIGKKSNRKSTENGWLELICGPMFSGKTEELIRRLNRAAIAGMKIEIFKPEIDNRYDLKSVVSHNKTSIRSTSVGFANDILLLSGNCEVIGVDEAQFFDPEIVSVCSRLANSGTRVIVAGLDLDYLAQPFRSMPYLLATAEYVTKLQAICMVCGRLASFSYRKAIGNNKVMIGQQDKYEPRCRRCYQEGLKNILK